MRILHVLDHSLPVSDGYSFRSHAIIREQHRLGWDTVQLTGPKHELGGPVCEEIGGLEYWRTQVPERAARRNPVHEQVSVVTALRRRLREIIATERPDVIHAHSPCLNALAAFRLGLPVIYEMRSSWEDAAVSNGQTTEGSLRYRASRALESYVLRRADAITTICNGLRDDVVARGVAADRVTVVPNAVDPAELNGASATDRSSTRTRYGLEGKSVIGFVGSYFAWEGLSLLLDALPKMVAQRPDIRVLLVGGGNEEDALRRQAERLGIQGAVVFAGRVPHAQVPGLYSAIDVLVYPRSPMRLTDMVTPLKPLEAMALGKLLIASDVGGHRELIRDGETGLLFPAGSASGLAHAVLRLLGDEQLQQRLHSHGPAFIDAERTWERVVPRYGPVYRQVIGAAP